MATRRELLFAAGAALAPGAPAPPWQPGNLDIHHINTGRGNATLLVGPDGTSLLIDVGAAGGDPRFQNAARPDDTRPPGEWVARYVQRRAGDSVDYVVLTHLHGDHIAGLPDFAKSIRIGKLIDRDHPRYDYPKPDPALTGGYVDWLRSGKQAVERIRVGSATQIVPRHGGAFSIRALSGNTEVWTGKSVPTENMCSIALRVNYGPFSYFTGGDLTCDTDYGTAPWRDVETPVARACGPVSVSTVNHHGYFDASGPEAVRALRPKVWILQSWHVTHPALSTLAALFSQTLYPGPRDVFALGLKPETYLACARFADTMKSREGHVLVRVDPGGARFRVLVLDDRNEANRVKAEFGPYAS